MMKSISDAVVKYLNMKTTGALMLTGDWGSGKTYYVKNELFPLIRETTKRIPIIVSLYGETDKNNIAQKVLFSFFDSKGEKTNLSLGTLAKNLKDLSDAIPAINNYLDVNKLVTGNGDNIFNLLPHDKLLICFDDLERIGEDINTNDFLGLVNNLVENKGCKVLIIANEEIIDDKKISFKEKTIEKTIHFAPNIPDVWNNIVEGYEDEKFIKYLNDNKDFLLKTINPKTYTIDDKEELEKSFSNIRTLKFIIEHFHSLFSIIDNSGQDLESELTQKKLKNVWTFIVAVSIEFKKPNGLSFLDRKGIDQYLPDFNIDLFLNNVANPVQEDNQKDESQDFNILKFRNMYFNRLSEKYNFYPQVYDFIIASKEINNTNFLATLDNVFGIKEGIAAPSEELLGKFRFKGWYKFSDDKFNDELRQLLNYMSKGEFTSLDSFFHTGIFLQDFLPFINLTKDKLINEMKKGIQLFLDSKGISYSERCQFNLVSDSFNVKGFDSVIEYTEQEIKNIEEVEIRGEVKKLESLLSSDIGGFVKEYSNNKNPIYNRDNPIFQYFDKTIIKDAIPNWKPEGIMELSEFLKDRYSGRSFVASLTTEKFFLKAIIEEINTLDLTENKLSHFIFGNNLKQCLQNCIEKLESQENI